MAPPHYNFRIVQCRLHDNTIDLQNFKAFDANVGIRTTGRIWCASFWCQGKSQLEVLWIRLQSIFIRNFTFYFKSKFIYSKVKRQSILPAVMMEKKNLTLYCQHLLLGAWMCIFIKKILFNAQVPSPFTEVGIRKWSKMAFCLYTSNLLFHPSEIINIIMTRSHWWCTNETLKSLNRRQ